MTDLIEQSLREALSERAAHLDPAAAARLRATDYHPRRRRVPLPALGAIATSAGAATVAAVVALGSGAAPAFAGWKSTPTTPAAGQLAQAGQACGAGLGTPVLSDTRGPYTASIYADPTTSNLCLSGNGVSMSTSFTAAAPITVAPGQIQLGVHGRRDGAGDALTVVDGQTGAGVTAVAIELSDGTSVQATVAGGWYLAWWPGTVTATNAQVTTASGTSSIPVPSMPALSCPGAATSCAVGYGYGSGARGASSSSSSIGGGTVRQSSSTTPAQP